MELLEFYHLQTNKREYEDFKQKLTKIQQQSNKVTICKAAELLNKYGYDGDSILEKEGIKGDDKSIHSKILMEITKLNLLISSMGSSDSEEVSFYEMLASVSMQAKFDVSEDITLANWCAKLKVLKEKNKAEAEYVNKMKR
jgi:hypothetical protein